MPIARMTKIFVLAPREMREELVDRLHLVGAVHIYDAAAASREDDELKALLSPFEPETRALRLAIARTEFIIGLLERFEEAKSGPISGFLKERIHLSLDEYMEVEKDFDLEATYMELEGWDVELRRIEGEISALEEEQEALRPWRDMDLALGETERIASVSFVPLLAGTTTLNAWSEELESRCPHVYWEEIGRERERAFVAALVHLQDLGEFDMLAGEFGYEPTLLGGRKGSVAAEIAESEDKLAAEIAVKERIEESIKEKLAIKPRVMALNDFLNNQLAKEDIKRRFLHTDSVVALEGWVEESRQEEVQDELRGLGMSTDVSFAQPEAGEETPTLMINRPRIRPAETLIELFGIPNRDETDPTPFVAPFFILFFGMCIGDVGYGLILAGAFWLALKKLDVSDNVKRFLRLFMYCGVVSIVVGVFTRGYFGIDSYLTVAGSELPGFLKFPGTMDLLYDPIPFMVICLALGLIHISIGVAIEMHDNMRQNSVWLGICEQGTTLVSWFGIAVAAIGFGAGIKAIGQVGLYILVAGVAGIIFLSNIQSKSIAGKVFGGLFNLYGLFASTIGDVASYLRLYALGLATIAIATVVNIMAKQVWGVPVLGIVLVLVVLLGGHAFNLAVSFLSAFVHPLRLQYVEFFSKFYEDGGEPFRPLALETRKTVIDEK
jgi:V/A-type H+/Na+-transporting ATPase subunit I